MQKEVKALEKVSGNTRLTTFEEKIHKQTAFMPSYLGLEGASMEKLKSFLKDFRRMPEAESFQQETKGALQQQKIDWLDRFLSTEAGKIRDVKK